MKKIQKFSLVLLLSAAPLFCSDPYGMTDDPRVTKLQKNLMKYGSSKIWGDLSDDNVNNTLDDEKPSWDGNAFNFPANYDESQFTKPKKNNHIKLKHNNKRYGSSQQQSFVDWDAHKKQQQADAEQRKLMMEKRIAETRLKWLNEQLSNGFSDNTLDNVDTVNTYEEKSDEEALDII